MTTQEETTTLLIEQINKGRKEYITDGYAMSIGELISLYKEGDLELNPDFQRLFRWSEKQQSALIESILIGVPIPPIFVYQTDLGKWEVVDGVQRISTILQFVGELKDENKEKREATTLVGTKLIPALQGMTWQNMPKEPLQLDFKRAKIEIKIIKSISHEKAKFEIFYRLNSGGTLLSDQEFRNCILVMVNKNIHSWLVEIANDNNFLTTLNLPEKMLQERYEQELVLRLFIFSLYTISANNLTDYINESLFYTQTPKSFIDKVADKEFDLENAKLKFLKTFSMLVKCGESNVFAKNGKGQFLESYFEIIAIGLYLNIDSYDEVADLPSLQIKLSELSQQTELSQMVGVAGMRAIQRIQRTVQFGRKYFAK